MLVQASGENICDERAEAVVMSAATRHEVSGRRCAEPMEPTQVHDLLLALLGLLSCQPYLLWLHFSSGALPIELYAFDGLQGDYWIPYGCCLF